MDKYCEHCYLRDANPCMECSTCNPGHRNFRPAPTPPPTHADRIRAKIDDIVDAQPTVDAVEVVRCRDCVHFGECLVTENDYCSKGERKETD